MIVRGISGFPGYGVTRDGRVWSNKRKGHWMKPWRGTNGYLRVHLQRNGKKIKETIHRLVAEAFILNPESKPQVNHRNGDKADNRVENLEWATSSENHRHAYATGLRVGTAGEANGSSKLTLTQVRALRERYAAGGVLQRELADEYMVSRQSVGDIINGKKWRGA